MHEASPRAGPGKPGLRDRKKPVTHTSVRGFHKSWPAPPSSELDKSSWSRSESWTSLDVRWRGRIGAGASERPARKAISPSGRPAGLEDGERGRGPRADAVDDH